MPYKYSGNDSSINTHLVSYKTFNRAVGYDFITEDWTKSDDNNYSAADIIQGIPIGKCYFKKDRIDYDHGALSSTMLSSPEIFGTSFTIDILVYIPSGYRDTIASIRTGDWYSKYIYIGINSNHKLYIGADYSYDPLFEETFSNNIIFNSLSHIEITVDHNTKTIGIFYNGRLLRSKDLSRYSKFSVDRCKCMISDGLKNAYYDYYKLPKYVKEVKIYDTILHTSSFTPPTQYTPTTYTEEFYKQYLLCYLPLDDKNHPFFDMCGNKWVYSGAFVIEMKKSLENSITDDCNVVKGFLNTRTSLISSIAKTQVTVKDPYNYTIDFYLLITSFDNVSSYHLLSALFEYSGNYSSDVNGIIIRIESGVPVFYYYDYGRRYQTNISLDFNKLTHIELSISNRSVYVYIDGECKFSAINSGTMTGRSQYEIRLLYDSSDHVYISQFRVFNTAVHSGTNNFERPNLYDYDVNYDNIKSINLITYHNGTEKSYPYYLWTSLYDFPLDSTMIHHNGYNWYNRNAHGTSNNTKIMYAHDCRKKYLNLTYAQAIWEYGSTDDVMVIENDKNNVNAGSGNDVITILGAQNKLLTETGNDTVYVYGEKNSISSSDGNKFITLDSTYNTISCISGTENKINYKISIKQNRNYINGFDRNSVTNTSITVESSYNSIVGGSGNNYIVTTNNALNNSITGSGNSTIQISGSYNDITEKNDSTYVITLAGSGHNTIQNDWMAYTNENTILVESDNNIISSSTNLITITSASKYNSIAGDNGSTVLVEGNYNTINLYYTDSIKLSDQSRSNIIYVSGGRVYKSTIIAGGRDNTLQIPQSFGSIQNGNDIIFNTQVNSYTGYITLQGGINNPITITRY